MTIVSNNCAGAYIYHDLGMRFDSPTINLQILPSEFPRFCRDFEFYMSLELDEYTRRTKQHADEIFSHLYGNNPYFPVGLLGDICILFQHYKTFQEAKGKWEERKKRIDYSHIGFVFVLERERKEAAKAFGNLNLPNSVLFTRAFDVDVPIEHHEYHIPEGAEYLGVNPETGRRYFEADFDIAEYARRIG